MVFNISTTTEQAKEAIRTSANSNGGESFKSGSR